MIFLPAGVVAPRVPSSHRRVDAREPLREEPVQILTGNLFHCMAEVVGRGIDVAEAPIVELDSLPEVLGAYLAAKYVQHPSAFLVLDLRQIGARSFGILMYDRRLLLAFGPERAIAVPPSRCTSTNASRPRKMFGEEVGEVGLETFAEPNIIPFVFGDGIAKPLVSDLVRRCAARSNGSASAAGGAGQRGHLPPAAPATSTTAAGAASSWSARCVRHHDAFARSAIAVIDLARMLHRAATECRGDVREFLICVRSDVLAEKLDGLPRGNIERGSGFRFLVRHPRLQLDALRHPAVMLGELLHANRIEPQCNRYRLLPVRNPAAVSK